MGGALLCGASLPASAGAAATCSARVASGDWPVGGRDLANTRSQSRGTPITPAAAGTLAPAWSFFTGHPSGVLAGGSLGDFNGTPIVAAGCVYVGSGASGAGVPSVFALNADTGALVWQRHLDTVPTAGLGGAIPGSPVYRRGTLYVLVNEAGDGGAHGPYVVALDARTGTVRWQSAPIVTTLDYYTNASLAFADGELVAGFSAREGEPFGHGGFAIVDAATGAVHGPTYTVPPSEWGTPTKPKFAGGGIWTTPAVDPVGRYAYMGTGNPYSKQVQYERTDAIIKVDVDPQRPTFGQIVAFHPGNIDQYYAALQTVAKPTCTLLPDSPLRKLPLPDQRLNDIVANSQTCLQADLDFGAAPNLFRDSGGRLIVGDLQKSGVYHAVYADDMAGAWTSLLGVFCQVCNASSTAYDHERRSIYAAVAPGALLSAISIDGGALRWTAPVADGIHFQPVSTSGGVVYSIDSDGFLDAWRAADGVPVLRRSLIVDGGTDVIPPLGSSSDGVAIARGTVYVEAGSHVIAYRPGQGLAPQPIP